MTEKVVRYNIAGTDDWMEGSDDGKWVRHSDYEKLAARVEELEEKYEDSDYRNVTLEKLDDDLRAEVKRLREALDDVLAVYPAGEDLPLVRAALKGIEGG